MADDVSGRRAAVGLGALSAATFVAVTTELLPVGVLPQMAADLHVSFATAGLSVSVFAVLVAALAVPLTVVTERIPRKLLLVIALLLYAVSNLVVAVAPDFAVLCAGRAVGGLSHAVFYSVVSAYAPALVPPHRVGRALSVAFAGASLGTVLGVPLTSFLGAQAGWRAAFAAMAVVAALFAAAVAVIVPSVVTPPHRKGERYRPGRGLIAIVTANALVWIGHSAAYTYIAPLLGRAGIEGTALSGILALLGVVSIGGLIAAGTLADRHLVGAMIGSAIVIAVALALLSFDGGSAASAVGTSVFWLLAFGAVSPLAVTAAVRTGAVSDSISGAVVNSASNVGITLGSLLGGGVIALGSLAALPAVGAVLAAAAAAVTLVARRRMPRTQSAGE
jgi:predicted MFS family arabinose efflux permease